MAIRFQFNEKKAVQAAAYLIQKNGGSMNYMALLKLLFLADRTSLLKRGRPITGDQIFTMKHGLVLTQILDRISQKKQDHRPQLWHEFIPPSITGHLSCPCRKGAWNRSACAH